MPCGCQIAVSSGSSHGEPVTARSESSLLDHCGSGETRSRAGECRQGKQHVAEKQCWRMGRRGPNSLPASACFQLTECVHTVDVGVCASSGVSHQGLVPWVPGVKVVWYLAKGMGWGGHYSLQWGSRMVLFPGGVYSCVSL